MATTLSAGDIAIIGVNSDNPDDFSFVLLIDIEANTEIRFTDSGWLDTNQFRSNEGAFKYTAPTNLSAGTVINFGNDAVNFASDNDADVGNNGFNLSSSGDQVIAFQGTSTNPTFIYAVQTNSTLFQTTASSSNDSALPNGLVNGTSAVAVGQASGVGDEWDNSVYNMSVTNGTKEEILAAVSNPANWTGSNDTLTIPSSSFTVGDSDNNNETDTTAPELNDSNPLIPADDGNNALVDANLTIKFNESIQKGTGNIVLRKTDDDSVVETFDVATSTAVTVSGDTVTINPTNNLEASTGFYVEIDAGAIEDAAGNDFEGISGNETWNFSTGTEDSITNIYQIQGAAHTSPLVGESVTTTGIVTAVGGRGFYLQDATGDNNNATSDAIFVFTGSNPTVTVGDDIEVSGTVSEFFPGGADTGNLSTTQISSPSVTVKSSGNTLPAATIIGTGGRIPPTENIDDDAFTSFEPDTDGIDFFESLEGMRVTAKDAVAVAPTNRFGEIFTVVDNGENATGLSERGTLNISPDDFNPEKVQINEDSGILPEFDIPEVNVGAKLGDVTGVVGYGFGNFEIYPTQEFTVTPSTIAAETTTLQGSASELTVASYNVLNLDPNDADGDEDVADGRFNAIANQIVSNLKTPDIIGLQEIQDNSGSGDDGVISADQTLQQLVDAIATAGGPTYSFIDNTFIGNNTSGGQPGGNIRTAFLYNTDRVDLVDGSVETIEDNGFTGSRLPLVAKFTFNSEEVTVVNNHFSSKGGSAPILGVEQPFEARQEDVNVNGSLDERQAQAQAVKGYVDGILAEDVKANVVVLGDLNEFEFVSPVETLAESLTNLTETVSANERYSFNFQGNSQSLDHILVSDNLEDNAEFDIVHVNSEFADTSAKASDHDPLVASLSFSKQSMDKINLSKIGTFTSEDGAEIVAYDPTTKRLFTTTGDTVEIIDINDPANPTKFGEIDLTSIGSFVGGGSNSVAVKNGIVAVAVEADTAQDNGVVAFYNTDGVLQNSVEVGALPDMLTFTPDGTKVIVANEGEPNDDYTVDPEGSIGIIDISGGVANLSTANVTIADFKSFNTQLETLKQDGVKIFGERQDGTKATVAEDLEPEYIAVSPDGTKAFVTLQENNAVAVLDIASATVEAIKPLGFKDHNVAGNGLDASNRDDGINIQNYPVLGMYQPDAIDSFEVDGKTYYITANEGDARIRPDGDIEDADGNVITEEGDIFNEEERLKDVTLDPTIFPNADELQKDENLGRLKITNTLGDTDGDGDFDQLYSFGGRSFSIWDDTGKLVFDSGDQIAQITASQTPEFFNANDGDTEEFDERSDDKGAEPESVTVGMVEGKPYGFVGLERAGGGVLVYDLSDPTAPVFNQYIRTEGDVAPEGLKFIAAEDSPNGNPVLAVANEESKTTTLYDIEVPNYTLQILHASDLEGGVDAIDSAANFAAIVDKLEDEFENTITLSAGDNYIPGPFFGAAGDRSLRTPLQEFYQEYFNNSGLTNVREGVGRVDISIMNAIGFDASAVGNHEFDAGTSNIADIIGTDIRGNTLGDARWLGAQFPYLSANLDFSGDRNLSGLYTSDILSNTAFQSTPDDLTAAAAAPKIAPATIIESGGEKIGVVGATTQLVETISSTGGVDVIDPESNNMAELAKILQPTIDKLIADGINKVVVVSHLQQIALEKELVGLLSGVDVVIAGGSDTLQADSTDVLRNGDTAAEDYPFETTNKDGDPAVIVSTDGEYSYVGRLVVDFDAQGKVILDSIDENVSGAYATDEAGLNAVYGEEDAFAEGSRGEQVKTLTQAVDAVVIAKDGIIYGNTDVFLEGRRSEVRTEETNFGNLTADANLAAAKKADESVVISIKNGGGIRAEIGAIDGITGEELPTRANPEAGKEAGEISQLDIENSLRFNNELTLLTVTAQELLDIIEHSVADSGDGKTPGRFPQVSGLKFSFDDDSEVGDRVESLAVVNEDGEIIDVIARDGELQGNSDRTFRIVTLNFLAGGGDGYPFPTGESANRVDLAEEGAARTGMATAADDGSEQDALAEYLATNFSTEADAFDIADVAPAQDMRIQNLDFREDTVLEGFNDLIGEIETTTLADGTQVESIDLTGLTGQATVNYTISREADFDNEVYFYAVDNINGTVDGIAVGEEGYMAAALANVISSEFSIGDDETETRSAQFDAGSVVVPLIIADGDLAEALSGAAEVYFPYLGANTDNGTFDHIKLLDSNTFGFEDLPNGGDEDFNDIEIRINSIA